MQPKELIELAAKAVGLNYCHATGFACRPDGEPPKPWNPWENSGDAFELGVSLRIIHHSDGDVAIAQSAESEHEVALSISDNDNDPIVATRRAIIHVAAKLACKMGHGEWRS